MLANRALCGGCAGRSLHSWNVGPISVPSSTGDIIKPVERAATSVPDIVRPVEQAVTQPLTAAQQQLAPEVRKTLQVCDHPSALCSGAKLAEPEWRMQLCALPTWHPALLHVET